MANMKFKFKTQPYQKEAVDNICDVFKGQPYLDMVHFINNTAAKTSGGVQTSFYGGYEYDDEGFENAKILLNERELLENIQSIQRENNYKVQNDLVHGFGACSLDIDMETGTGKTYVYIKSIFELNKRYGWSKFIIVVPSVAIREGVLKSFSVMEEHFMEQYGKKARYFIYNSKKLSKLNAFAASSDIQVMIINQQAFNAVGKINWNTSLENIYEQLEVNAKGKENRRIYAKLDEFQSDRPISVISKTRPILILDEPQKMGGEATQNSLRLFNSLFSLSFSATHKKHNNLIYVLDALDAYNKNLVKKIQVKGFEIKNLRGTDKYLYLQDIVLSSKQPPKAKLEFEIKFNKSINRETRILSVGQNLYRASNGMEQYKNGYVISDINPYTSSITFLNGETLKVGEVFGDISDKDKRRIQIRETITSHFEKEESLFSKGIKCLSLFFIDEVKKYRDYSRTDLKGEYARIFEHEYQNILQEYLNRYETPYIKYLKGIDAEKTHKGYFSIDKKTHQLINSKDNKETGSDDINAYKMILTDKEKLLSFEEPTRFIFSHSALREGWDNPNVFQICALKPSGDSPVAKRQEVGRGLRIAVNKLGERVDLNYCGNRSAFLNINRLTVVADDSYQKFVSNLQKAIRDDLADRPTRATTEYFMDKIVKCESGNVVVDKEMALDICTYLRFSGYVDQNGFITKEYFKDKNNNSFAAMQTVLSPYTDSIHKLIQSIFDENILENIIENERKPAITENPFNDNFNKPEFQKLWKQINHRYIYSVMLDSEKLIHNSIKALNEKLFVSQVKYIVTTGEQLNDVDENQLKAGQAFVNTKTRREFLKNFSSISANYDLIGKIKDGTNLTRFTIAKIIQGIEANIFALFEANPEAFISRSIDLINEQKAYMTVDNISYSITEDKFEDSIFTSQSRANIDKVVKVTKSIQEYVFLDGTAEKCNERKFVEELEHADEVSVYAKLPKTFQIPTPVGYYSPDWIIAFKKTNNIKHQFVIVETKATTDVNQLRGIEVAKINCTRKLFNKLKLGAEVRFAVVDSYDALLDVIKNID